ncbi:hypothetical protein DNTS_014940 [Danionella cerebrum]|uniref:Uncharacterized protein n=1 Tax=Danionella cerebrum TaxID=2873325 RepID=A0A553RJ16_9TELE|nr:hypothetical protein DNTS_014940 [Danionella translucida]
MANGKLDLSSRRCSPGQWTWAVHRLRPCSWNEKVAESGTAVVYKSSGWNGAAPEDLKESTRKVVHELNPRPLGSSRWLKMSVQGDKSEGRAQMGVYTCCTYRMAFTDQKRSLL